MPWKAAHTCSSERKHAASQHLKTNEYQALYNDFRLFFTISRTPLPTSLPGLIYAHRPANAKARLVLHMHYTPCHEEHPSLLV